MSWIPLLLIAVAFEVAGTTCMKFSQGFTRPIPSVLLFVFYGASFICLTFLLRRIDIGIAYALWSAIGTALVALIGIAVFHESVTAMKLISLALIIAGVVGLRLGGTN